MHRAFSFPVTVERSRTKERLEASLAGLCELELRKQRQECLVLGALALGDPLSRDPSRGELGELFSTWGQENLTLRRQLSALQSSPWGLMQALEQQVGELRIDTDDGGGGGYDGVQADPADSRPSSGFYESSEGQSPKGRSCSAEPAESSSSSSSWANSNDRPKSVGDPQMHAADLDVPVTRTTLPRSFSAPYPPLEGIAEEGTGADAWQWDLSRADLQQAAEDQLVSEEDYEQAVRVEGYILSLVQRHALSLRPCQPRTNLCLDPGYCPSRQSTLHRRTPSLTAELPDPHVNLSLNPKSQSWGCDLLEGDVCGGEIPSFEEDCYLALPYPQSRPHSLAGRLPSPLTSQDPKCGVGALDLCCQPPSPQHYMHPQPPTQHKHNLVNAHYIPGQGCHAPVRTPRHYNPEPPGPNQVLTSADPPNSKPRTSKKGHSDRQRSKKSSSKTNRSQSENSLLGQRGLPERRYSTTERHQGKGDQAQNQRHAAAAAGLQAGGSSGNSGHRRWCSNLELSQDEGETHAGQAQKRPPRRARHGHPCPSTQLQSYHHHHYQHAQPRHPDCPERAPLCQAEEGYGAAAPAESESSMSEVYSPVSSSLSSDSDESGGLVWPQQLPPRLASSSSSSSPSAQASAKAPSQPKAFVKIKASHALKKKILRFRSGSLKVMTTV
ncbi:dapper homolog 3-like [Genypterus blacodes]|uniref:dapper homolog 3-like n=1 Tax=Genypterus blacodes TaxID=154954 RepID=UPI003F75FC1D